MHQPKRALHTPWTRVDQSLPFDDGVDFANLAADVCLGIQSCIELVAEANLERSFIADGTPDCIPLIGENTSARLLQLAAASAHMLAVLAEKRIDTFNEKAKGEKP